ncbi:MAG TPA: transglycosylase SLT domain-containing protein, partial [Polyangia bacterium]
GGWSSGPAVESQAERRAVRGSAVEDGLESPELSELRRFEEDAFPRERGNEGEPPASSSSSAPPAGLPGRWDGSGDVPEVLRTPEAAAARPAPTTPDSEWLRSLNLPELPVRWDARVLRYLDYFRADPRGRAVMTNWLRRAGRYRAVIENALAREGVPKDLLYVAMIESSFEPMARSRVGAGGIWQFMPGAARAYGLEVGYWIDARRDPERQSEAAARYLKDLYARFGSWPLVFAAYNAGYGAVLKSITRYNTNDYWELCRHEAGLPWESSLYVPKILAAAIVGHNLEAFGYGDVVPDPPLAYDKVEVPAGTTLATVARAARVRLETIEALNSQISRGRTPPDRVVYPVRLPAGSGATFVEAFERMRGPGDRLETVTLRFGETLDDVARAHGTTARELRKLNGVKESSELRAGMALVCPARRKPAAGAEAGRGAVAAGAGETDQDASSGTAVASTGGDGEEEEILVAVPDRTFSYEGRERVFYRTREGDTLEAIAGVLAVRAEDLVTWNNLDPQARLHPKMVLQAFVPKDYDPTQVVLLDPARVRVVTLGSDEFLELEAARRGKKRLVIEAKANDTLAKLGRRYGLTLGDLARINRFPSSTELHEGQKVVVYSPVGEPGRDVARGLAHGPSRRDRGSSEGLRGAAVGTVRPLPKVTAKLEKLDKVDRVAKGERGDKADRSEKSDRAEKAERGERGDRSTDRGGERDHAGGPARASGAATSAVPKGSTRPSAIAAADRDRKEKERSERPSPRGEAKVSAAGTGKPTSKKK